MEQLDFADPGKRITHRLARYVYELRKTMTVEDVARHFDLNPKTVKAVDKHFLQQAHGRTECEGLRIAIDEIAIRKRHQYMTDVLDYESGRVVWMGEGRHMQVLNVFFAEMLDADSTTMAGLGLGDWDRG